MIENMDKEVKALEDEMIQLAWIMRGGITLNETYALSPSQRLSIAELYKKNLETTKESGLPFF